MVTARANKTKEKVTEKKVLGDVKNALANLEEQLKVLKNKYTAEDEPSETVSVKRTRESDEGVENAGAGDRKRAKVQSRTVKAASTTKTRRPMDKVNKGGRKAEKDDGGRGGDGISRELENELNYLKLLVNGLTKDYLRDVMVGLKGRKFCGGTNAEMREAINRCLEEDARWYGDLGSQGAVIRGVDRMCYGRGDEEDWEGLDDLLW